MIFLWVILAIVLLECGFHRVGFSMLFPPAALFLLWNWYSRKRRGMLTDTFDTLGL